MKDLGDLCGLDYNTAYFLKYGKIPPYLRNECSYAPASFDWEQDNKPDPYYCWQGTRIPQWFEG
ncbi:MAG: hypothetical protein NC191_04415 [Muribaculaceae bacterium]|nr:hypothetical protein [Muribaculaceae bacterium]